MNIPGLLEVRVSTNGGINLQADSFPTNGFRKLGQLSPGKIELQVTMEPALIAIHVDGKKNVTRMNYSGAKGTRRVKTFITARKGENGQGVAFTVYPENNLRLVSAAKEKIAMWEIAIVSQHGIFFLTSQETLSISLKQGLGGLTYGEGTRLKEWPQMMELAKELLEVPFIILPQEDAPGILSNKAIWWNVAQGLGAIQTRKGAARVHWSQITPREQGLRYLVKDELVEYNRLVPITPKPETKATSFKWEARGVTLSTPTPA